MMKYYSYQDMDGKYTLSEDEILKEYFPFWNKKMKEKYGDKYPSKFNESPEKMALTDWIIVHWATETDEDGNEIAQST